MATRRFGRTGSQPSGVGVAVRILVAVSGRSTTVTRADSAVNGGVAWVAQVVADGLARARFGYRGAAWGIFTILPSGRMMSPGLCPVSQGPI